MTTPAVRAVPHDGLGITSRRVDSDMGSWTHTEWRPEPSNRLSWAVEAIWDFDGWTAHRRERVLPQGGVELLVQLDEPYQDVHGVRTVPTPALCVTGIQTGPLVIQAPSRGCRVLAIRFHPLGAWAVLRHPLRDLTNATVDLRDVLSTAAAELGHRTSDARDGHGRVRRAVAWLHHRVMAIGAERIDPSVRHVARRMASGTTRVGPLRAETGMSSARLSAAFLEQVGVTPKRYARVHRFRRAVELLRGGSLQLTDVALGAGYYDQPHMNAEFRVLAGLTPGQYLAAPRYPSSTSAAED